MPFTLDKPNPLESQQELIQTPDRHTPEAQEYDEAGLKEMIDQAHRQIDSEQGQIFDMVNRRMEGASATVDLAADNAAAIKLEYREPIEEIKERIAKLGDSTKTRIQNVSKPNSETNNGLEQEKISTIDEVYRTLHEELLLSAPAIHKIKQLLADLQSKVSHAQMALMENSGFSPEVFTDPEYVSLRELSQKAAAEVNQSFQEMFNKEMSISTGNAVEQPPLTIEQIEAQANFEGDNTELLIRRLTNPDIHNQLTRLLYLDRKYDITISHQSNVDEISTANLAAISAVSEYTPITFTGEMPSASMVDDVRESLDILFEYPEVMGKNGIKQKNITEAHEKGHTVRKIRSEAATIFFKKCFDFKAIHIAPERLEKLRDYFHNTAPDAPVPTDNDVYESLTTYFSNPMELIERMSQLKNYFGMSGNEIFTKKHLEYAREHYMADTKIDNHMSEFFQMITPQSEAAFLDILNRAGI